MTDTTDWLLLSLAPVAPERVEGWFDGIAGLQVTFPVARTRAAVRAAIGTADIVPTTSGGPSPARPSFASLTGWGR